MKIKTHFISKVIDTDIETLFKLVSDFDQYKKWNSVIPDAKGKFEVGTELQLTMKIDGKNKPFNPKIIAIVPNKSFLLSKTLLSKNIFELSHQFDFKSLKNNQTEFTQTWKGQGIVAVLIWEKIRKEFSSFEKFNDDILKYINTKE